MVRTIFFTRGLIPFAPINPGKDPGVRVLPYELFDVVDVVIRSDHWFGATDHAEGDQREVSGEVFHV